MTSTSDAQGTKPEDTLRGRVEEARFAAEEFLHLVHRAHSGACLSRCDLLELLLRDLLSDVAEIDKRLGAILDALPTQEPSS